MTPLSREILESMPRFRRFYYVTTCVVKSFVLVFPPLSTIFFLYPLYPTLPLLLRRSSVSGPTNFRNYETVSLKWRLEINPWKKRFLLVATLFSSLSLFLSPFFPSLFLISTFILLLNFARCEERSVGW